MPPPPTKKALPLDPDVLTQELTELGDLTPRQAEVIRLSLFGEGLHSIAARMGCGWRTAKDHRARAFERLGVGSVGQLWGLLLEFGGHTLEPLPRGRDEDEESLAS